MSPMSSSRNIACFFFFFVLGGEMKEKKTGMYNFVKIFYEEDIQQTKNGDRLYTAVRQDVPGTT